MISVPMLATTRWKIVTDEPNFDRLKTEESFWCVVALGRAVNALRFVQMPLIEHEQDNSPAAIRARYNSLFFSCAVFAEGVLVVRKLTKHFWQWQDFKNLSGVTNSKESQEILSTNLFHLRNKLVFHFDPGAIGKQLQELTLQEPIFVTAMGQTNSQVYYDLSDLCAMRAFSGPQMPSGQSALDFMRHLVEVTSVSITEFSNAAEKFMVTFLEQNGWEGTIISERRDTSLGL